MIFIITQNTSKSDAIQKLAIMNADMAALLQEGGKVVRAEENAKFGGAFLTRVLSDEGWSDRLLAKYRKTLETRGWYRSSEKGIIYCKNGMLAEIEPQSGMYQNVGTNYVGMTYNAGTITQCKYYPTLQKK